MVEKLQRQEEAEGKKNGKTTTATTTPAACSMLTLPFFVVEENLLNDKIACLACVTNCSYN